MLGSNEEVERKKGREQPQAAKEAAFAVRSQAEAQAGQELLWRRLQGKVPSRGRTKVQRKPGAAQVHDLLGSRTVSERNKIKPELWKNPGWWYMSVNPGPQRQRQED